MYARYCQQIYAQIIISRDNFVSCQCFLKLYLCMPETVSKYMSKLSFLGIILLHFSTFVKFMYVRNCQQIYAKIIISMDNFVSCQCFFNFIYVCMPETVSKHMPQLSFLGIILFHFSAFLKFMHPETVILRHNYNFLKGVKTTTYCAI